MKMLAIECRCGAVGLEVTGAPIAQFYCHCDDCQSVHGAAYVPESVYRAEQVRVVRGETIAWKLKRNPRVTCPKCGTRLFIDVVAFGLRGVNGYNLPSEEFAAQFHVHCKFAVRPIVDALPHYKAMPPMFRGSDDRVDW
jgi:hypothetical protein